MGHRRFDVKQLFRRLVAGHAVGQLYGISCGPCAPIPYQPPDVTLSESEITNEPLAVLCSHVCSTKGFTCAGADASSADPLPVSFACRVAVERERPDETVAVDAATFGEAERDAWLTLSDLAQLKTKTQPTTGAGCSRVCASASARESANRPDSCSYANRQVTCTPPLAQSVDNCAAGRVPFGLAAPVAHGARDEADRFWLLTEHMEAASVVAFGELADALERHRAPLDLVARCRAAAEEEHEHARFAERELRARGLAPAKVRHAPPVAPSLLDVALHNAAEGCVTESIAALLALHESKANPDPALRAFFARVAAEEAEHAQLAWDLHAWFLATLPAGEAGRLSSHLEEVARAARRRPTDVGSTLFDAMTRHTLATGLVEQVLDHTRA